MRITHTNNVQFNKIKAKRMLYIYTYLLQQNNILKFITLNYNENEKEKGKDVTCIQDGIDIL